MWDQFRTTYGRVYNGITGDCTRLEIFNGHVGVICSANSLATLAQGTLLVTCASDCFLPSLSCALVSRCRAMDLSSAADGRTASMVGRKISVEVVSTIRWTPAAASLATSLDVSMVHEHVQADGQVLWELWLQERRVEGLVLQQLEQVEQLQLEIANRIITCDECTRTKKHRK